VGRGAPLFARSTRAGLVQGARYAAAALIDRAVEEGQALLGRQPLVVLTGGQAAAVRPLLRSPCVVVPDLVLRGLAALARREASPGGSWEITRPDQLRKSRRSRRA